ncbi:ABC transporter ATP-binding protein [Paenibacillus sp. FSL K6-2524]|uniref:ABC transporter ATP-binding protein n=1 Tax=Paenibacillus sp. FSL K6-2524 TaxID=2954516 RepID=UPI0030FC514D
MQPVISFRDFSFRYKSQSSATLKNINLDIVRGEKIWIAGPSGSGKSTLAHCINGLIPFSYGGEITGELYVNGKDSSSQDIFERSKSVGTILQNPDAQFVGQTVGEDVAFQMENEATPQAEMKTAVFSALDLVGMLDYEGQGPHDLSGGQKQSVSLAGVLSTKADILLFDEPLANLDPASGVKAMRLIEEIHQAGGKTVIIIEHRVEDVLQEPIDRIVVMNEGEIAAIGTPDDLLAGGILASFGLRQPIYLDAMAYAGLSLQGLSNLRTPEGILGTLDKGKLEVWMDSVESTQEQRDGDVLLELRDVTYAYDAGRDVVRQVSLSIGAGETIALLGGNGAGKSTLSGIITGLFKPRIGEVRLWGESINNWSIRRRGTEIGYVMQNPNHMITQHMIRDEVGLGLTARGFSPTEREERSDEVLKICGLYPYRNWPVSALSFGQKKRLSIASILALSPKLMILDEPTAGQDYRHYTEFMDFIAELSNQGMAFLFITHDMHLALEYADRAVVMAEGGVIAADTVANVLSNSEVTSKARLRETSLARFARAWGLSSPSRFVQAFIDYEQKGKTSHE